MWIRPTDDPTRAVVRDHRTGSLIPAEGMEVPDHDFDFLQRIAHGDLLRGKAPEPVAQAPALPSPAPAAPEPAPEEA